jgi:hypothetical protein
MEWLWNKPPLRWLWWLCWRRRFAYNETLARITGWRSCVVDTPYSRQHFTFIPNWAPWMDRCE